MEWTGCSPGDNLHGSPSINLEKPASNLTSPAGIGVGNNSALGKIGALDFIRFGNSRFANDHLPGRQCQTFGRKQDLLFLKPKCTAREIFTICD